MELNEYQKQALKFQLPAAPPEERIFGLLEESGEVAAVFKRLLRGDYAIGPAQEKLKKELGDVLWYLATIANDNEWTLEEVAKENIDKLDSRKIRNMILGEGGDR